MAIGSICFEVFLYTFYFLAAFFLFSLGVSAIVVMPEDIFPGSTFPCAVIWQDTGPERAGYGASASRLQPYAMSIQRARHQ